MAKNFLLKGIIAGLGFSSVLASTASAVPFKMNAMCYLKDKQGAQTQAFNPTDQEIRESGSSYVRNKPTNVTAADVNTKFRIASLSKVLVTHWAVAKLGPEYRFKTKVHINPGVSAQKTCYVHLQGDRDIFLGKEMLTTVFQQLKPILSKSNCETIAQLSYDENLVIPLYGGSSYIFEHRSSGSFRGSNPTNFYGPLTTKKALSNFVSRYTSLKVKDIKAVPAAAYASYLQKVPVKTYSFRSRPLYMMMREFNAYSSNVPPNILFERLGGAAAYAKFIKARLGIDSSDAVVLNGSGYPVFIDDKKIYNEVSCDSIVRIIQDLDHMLRAYKGSKSFQMADVMPVGGRSGETYSTFKALYSSSIFTNTLTAKTGSADRAITFAGHMSTAEGSLYFAALTEPAEYRQLSEPRTYIRDLITILAERQNLKPFNYTQIGLMTPTDKYATLVEEKASIALNGK